MASADFREHSAATCSEHFFKSCYMCTHASALCHFAPLLFGVLILLQTQKTEDTRLEQIDAIFEKVILMRVYRHLLPLL